MEDFVKTRTAWHTHTYYKTVFEAWKGDAQLRPKRVFTWDWKTMSLVCREFPTPLGWHEFKRIEGARCTSVEPSHAYWCCDLKHIMLMDGDLWKERRKVERALILGSITNLYFTQWITQDMIGQDAAIPNVEFLWTEEYKGTLTSYKVCKNWGNFITIVDTTVPTWLCNQLVLRGLNV